MSLGRKKGEWAQFTLPEACSELSYEDAASIVPLPRKWWEKLKRTGGVRVQGNRLLLHAFPPEESDVEPEWLENVRIVFEDDYCLVADKPAGMPVHPNEAGQRGTLAAAVAAHYTSTGQSCRIRHIHRLDTDTSGLVLYAKNEWAHVLLDEQMRQKAIRRDYLAIVQGRVRKREGKIDAPIGRDRHHATRRRVSPNGDAAVTRYRVREVLDAASLLELTLETGRTHQIRVHASYLGHPLVGDKLYGGSTRLLDGQALHGYRLTFEHPIERRTIELTSELPSNLLEVLERLRAGSPV